MLRYLLAVICPPAAVLGCRRFDQFVLNVALTLCLWIPGVVHASFIVQHHIADAGPSRVAQQMRHHRLNSIMRRP